MVTIDFETYYRPTGDDKYGLRSHTMEEYIRHPEFQVIGFAYKWNDGPSTWVTGTAEHMAGALHRLQLHSEVVVAHNAPFDMAILSWRYGIRPRRIVDTLAMAAACGLRTRAGGSLSKLAEFFWIGVKGTEVVDAAGLRREDFSPEQLAQYGEYCKNDVDLTYALLLNLKDRVLRADIIAIDSITRMFTEPQFVLNGPLLRQRLTTVQEEKQSALCNLAAQIGCTVEEMGTHLRSSEKFAALLLAQGELPDQKVTVAEAQKAKDEGREPKQVYAFAKTDAYMTYLLQSPNPMVVALAETRLGERSNIEENRLTRFVGISERGKLPVPLTYSAAATGRWGGADKLNMQNLPKRVGGDITLRRSMMAPPGHKVVAVDSSSVELRIAMYVAGQVDVLAALAAGDDVYAEMAGIIYRRPIAHIVAEHKAGASPGKMQRAHAKAACLGGVYGMSATRFCEQSRIAGVPVEPSEGAQIIDTYRAVNNKVVEFWGQCGRALEQMLLRRPFTFGGPTGSLFRVDYRQLRSSAPEPCIVLPDGTVLWYEGLTTQQNENGRLEYVYQRPDETTRRVITARIYGARLFENLCQALAFAALKWQVYSTGFSQRWPLALNVHDEFVSVVPEAQATLALADLMKVMSTTPPWLPGMAFGAEGGTGDNYAEV